MKKVLSVLLALTMMCSMLAACGSSSSKETSSSGAAASGETAATDNAAAADDGKVYKMRISNEVPEDNPISMAEDAFAEALEEKSGGRIEVTVYKNSTLTANAQEGIQMAMDGTLEMTTIPGANFSTASDQLDEFLIGDYPYIFNTFEDAYKLWDSDLGKEMTDHVSEVLPLYVLPAFAQGWNILAGNTEMVAPEDTKNLKLRVNVNPMYTATFEKLPCAPFSLAFNEVYTALQQGTCDALQTSAGTLAAFRFYEVADYVTTTNHSIICLYPIINAAWYDSLPDDLKAIFDECAADFVQDLRARHEVFDQESLQMCGDNGMTITDLTDEQREAWREALVPVQNEKADMAGAEFVGRVQELLAE